MTVKLEQLLMLIGAILLGIAIIFGFMPVKANGISCGAALTGQSDEAHVQDLTNSMTGFGSMDNDASCEDSVSGRRTVTFALGIPGIALLAIGGALVGQNRAEAASRRS
jgi:hypothetical protein